MSDQDARAIWISAVVVHGLRSSCPASWPLLSSWTRESGDGDGRRAAVKQLGTRAAVKQLSVRSVQRPSTIVRTRQTVAAACGTSAITRTMQRRMGAASKIWYSRAIHLAARMCACARVHACACDVQVEGLTTTDPSTGQITGYVRRIKAFFDWLYARPHVRGVRGVHVHACGCCVRVLRAGWC